MSLDSNPPPYYDEATKKSPFSLFSSIRQCEHEVLSEDPVILRFKGFLTQDECNGVIDLSKPLIQKCELIGIQTFFT